VRRITAALTVALLGTSLLAGSAAGAATDPKIVIIVGAVHGQTSSYLSRGQDAYEAARQVSSNVVKVFSPCATWSKVKSALQGAAVVIYMGHGNGYPSPYRTSPWPYSQNGFGLNATCNDGHDNTTYYGEYYIGNQVDLAPNAVVLLHHLCYASGNSEPGNSAPSFSVAKQRVDNYGAGFLKAGAGVVIAEAHSDPDYYLWAIFNTQQTMDEMWRAAPSFHDHVRTWASTRSPGRTAQVDPDSSAPSGYYRSIVGELDLTTDGLTRVDVMPPKAASPFGEPSASPDSLAPSADVDTVETPGDVTDAASQPAPVDPTSDSP